jgi:putative ABC transport system permease protein
MLSGRTPLGYLQLAHNKTRFIVACSGVGFAVVLVFMQLGFMNMLFDSTVQLHKQFKADAVVLSAEARGLVPDSGSFSRRRLLQASGVDGVDDWAEVYIGTLSWTKPSDGEVGNITVFGVPVNAPVFKDATLEATKALLKRPDTFLLDEGARGDYTAFFERIRAGDEPQVKFGGRTGTAVGTFTFGSTFGTEAIAIVSTETFLALAPNQPAGVINMGLLRVSPGQTPDAVAARIQQLLEGTEVKAMSMDAFIELTRSFLRANSPIATVFTFGVIVGLIVGAIIVIQILSSDVQDHLSEYATFKAMGFSNGYLLRIVYEQSAILTVFGFLPALAVSFGLYQLIGSAVAMDMQMTPDRIVMVLALTIIMCAVSGTIAMRRIFSADPAEVF